MRNILFFVTGIGFGDAVREYAIIKELKKKEDVRIKIAAYGMSKLFFEHKFPIVGIRGFNAASSKFNLESNNFMKSNAALPLTWNSQVKQLQEETKKFNPDLVVTDFEPLGVMFARKTKRKFIEVFGVEPKSFEEFWRQKKRPIFHKLQANFLRGMYNAGNLYGEGVIVPSINKEKQFGKFKFVNLIVRETGKGNRLGKGKIVIMLGGSTFGVALGKILLKVLPKIDKEFVMFGFESPKEKISNVEFITIKENAQEYVKNSSGVITLAGHSTISEALAFGKPILSFPIPNHIEQEYNGYVLKKNNLGMVKEYGGEIREEFLIGCIKEFLDKRKIIEKNVEKAKIKSNGAEQAAKIISDILR